jgi:hypothetical protein
MDLKTIEELASTKPMDEPKDGSLYAVHKEDFDWLLAASRERDRLADAAVELLAVAKLRGDDELPHPANDPKLWTARMQAAWCDLESATEASRPNAIAESVSLAQAQEKSE